MIEVFWNTDIIPNEFKGVPMDSWGVYRSINIPLFQEAARIQKGATVLKIAYPPILQEKAFALVSPIDGFLVYNIEPKTGLFSTIQPSPNTLLFTIYTYDECYNLISPLYQISVDDYTGKTIIKWNSFKLKSGNIYKGDHNFFRFDNFKFISFDYDEGAFLRMRVLKDRFKPKAKDKVYLLFANRDVLTVSIKNNPIKEENYYNIGIELNKSDVDKLCSVPLVSVKLESKTTEPYEFKLELFDDAEMGQAILKKFANKFAEALDEIGFKWETEVEKENTPSDSPCFVYLMVDTANGYHKIGISNHPEYREGTLQSEKPTIELLCAKQFPSRTIAKAIESALHKTYEGKHLRGEWFQLDAKDIIDLMATLK